jgi:hypothetical protein
MLAGAEREGKRVEGEARREKDVRSEVLHKTLDRPGSSVSESTDAIGDA